jgi:hypothetical protein
MVLMEFGISHDASHAAGIGERPSPCTGAGILSTDVAGGLRSAPDRFVAALEGLVLSLPAAGTVAQVGVCPAWAAHAAANIALTLVVA